MVELAQTYHLLATVLQFALLGLLLSLGRLDALRAALCIVVGVSGLETLVLLGLATLPPYIPVTDPSFGILLFALDTAIVLSIPYVLAHFPTSLFRAQGSLATWIWLIALAVAPVTTFVAALDARALAWHLLLLHEVPFALGAVLLAVWLVPGWRRLAPGPLRAQTLLVGAGFGIGLVYQSTIKLEGAVARLPRFFDAPLVHVVERFVAMAHWSFGYLALASVLAYAVTRRSRDAALFASLLSLGAVLPLVEEHLLKASFSEFATQAVRPLLLTLAVVRFEMYRVPRGARAVFLPIAGLGLGLMAFLLLTLLFSGVGLEAGAVDPTATLAGAIVVGGFAWRFRRTIADLFSSRAPRGERVEILQRYRLAVERARSRGIDQETDQELGRLREDLGVTDEEHAAFEAILQSHLVIPTAAVVGAGPGTVVAGRFEVVRELGAGGFGRALLAKDAQAGRLVVLKEAVRPWEPGFERRRESLEREARVGAALASPNLPRVMGTVTENGNTYLVREYVPGETLAERAARAGPVTPQTARRTLVDVLSGLSALHAAGLLHLDLKPENVVVDERGRAVIIDFGTARRIASDAALTGGATATSPRTAAGTLAWMAPEQVLGRPVDERTDVFAAGALMYWLLTGRHHVDTAERSGYEVEDAIVRGQPPAAPRAPEDIRDAIGRALARDPAQRFATAGEFARAITPGTRADSFRRR